MKTKVDDSKVSTAEIDKKPSILRVLIMLVFYALFMYLSWIVTALESPQNGGFLIGQLVGAFIVPIIIVCLFQGFKRFRNSKSQTTILIWALLLCCLSTAGRFSEAEKSGVQSWLKRGSESANEGLPKMIDESTRFERHFTIIDVRESDVEQGLLEDVISDVRKNIVQEYCGVCEYET